MLLLILDGSAFHLYGGDISALSTVHDAILIRTCTFYRTVDISYEETSVVIFNGMLKRDHWFNAQLE